MSGAVGSIIRDRVAAARSVLGEADLRRLNVAYACVQLGGWAGFVAISLYAYRHGGAGEVGLLTAIRLGPTALASPFAGVLADRFRRKSVFAGAEIVRAGAQGLAAVLVISQADPVGVYVAVAAASLAETTVDPARAALLPTLARTPEQLTAANALEATVDGGALTLGPAIGGLLVGVSSIQLVLVVDASAAGAAAILALAIHEPRLTPEAGTLAGIARRSLVGFRTIAGEETLRVVIGVFAAQMLAFGLLLVFVVSIPLQELHAGASGVGWLNAAIGVGAVAGGVMTMTLKGGRLAPPLLLGMCLIAAGYATVAAIAALPAALVALAAMNLGACYVDVATFTLLQRAVPEEMLARAFSVVGTIVFASLLAGAVIAPALISAFGLRTALGVTAAAVLACIGLAYPALRRVDSAADAPGERLDLLAAAPLFRVLPAPVVERLASKARETSVAAGELAVAQGEPADAYYVIARGRAEVLVDGSPVAELGPGDAFGEIALLLDRPRTATVRAIDDLRLERLDRDTFLQVVGGHDETRHVGDEVSRALLARASPGGPLA